MRQRRLVISEPARNDLDDIYDFISGDNPDAADRFVTGVLNDLHSMAVAGHIGAPRDWISPGLRLHVHGRFSAYCRFDDTTLTLVRFLRGAQDIGAITFVSDDYT